MSVADVVIMIQVSSTAGSCKICIDADLFA